MSEEEWLTTHVSSRMLKWLEGKTSDRKYRLFAVACCRQIWDLLPDSCSRHTVEVAERFADGLASREELQKAYTAAPRDLAEGTRPLAASCAATENARNAAKATASATGSGMMLVNSGAGPHYRRMIPGIAPEVQAALVREVFGNPFAPPLIMPETVRMPTVLKLASAIYEERAWNRLPILADALEESGYADATVLGHLRGEGPHCRGCFALDAVLGRK